MAALYDNKNYDFTVQPGCPWYEAQQTYGPPNVNWCEPTTCSYINEPVNTWSNLGFLLIGIYIFLKWKKSPIKYFGIVVLVMGVLSGVYHASNNFLTQIGDFVGMSLMMSYLLAFQFERTFHNLVRFWYVFAGFLLVNFTLLYTLHHANLPVQMLLMINAIPLILWDLWNGWRKHQLKFYGAFVVGFVTLIVAQISAQVDLKRIYCEPDNMILHGHMIWHVLCAVAMYFIAVHMSRVKRS